MEEQYQAVKTEMEFALAIHDLIKKAQQLEVRLEFNGNEAVILEPMTLPIPTLDHLQGFLEGVEYALEYMVEVDDEE